MSKADSAPALSIALAAHIVGDGATANLRAASRWPGYTAGGRRGSAASTLRWMLIHMVEETARHVGHGDIIRELLDGEKGYY